MMRQRILIIIITVIFAVACFSILTEAATKTNPPKINVVFLDYSAALSKDQSEVVRNDWLVWKQRLPHFIPALQEVAAFQPGQSGKYQSVASLFSILLSNRLGLKKQKEVLTRELSNIFKVTRRPSCILSRSTTGYDQLSIVFQDNRDYPPEVAAEMIIQLGESGPPDRVVVWPRNYGPFQPPPTVIVDYRTNVETKSKDLKTQAQNRWGILESGYLLPEYVLHAIAVLNESIVEGTGTFYRESKPDVGAGLIVHTDGRDTAWSALMDRYGPVGAGKSGADLFGIKDMKVDPKTGIRSYKVELGIGRYSGISKRMTWSEITSRLTAEDHYTKVVYGDGASDFKHLKDFEHYGADAIGRLPETYTARSVVLKDFGIGMIGKIPMVTSVKFGLEDRTYFPKPGGILFDVGNSYKVDPTGKVALYAKLAKEAKGGEFDAEGKKMVTGGIPLDKPGPMEVGWSKLVDVDVLDTTMGRLPLAIPRFYNSASETEGSLGKDWTFDFAEINFDAEKIVPVKIDKSEMKLPFEVTFVERETGAELLYDLSYWAGILKGSEGSAVLYGATQSIFQPDLIAKQDGTYVIFLKHETSIIFNANGQPIALKDRSGGAIQFSRKGKKIMSLKASDGKRFNLNYKGDKLTSVDADGGKLLTSYQYNDKGLLSEVAAKGRNIRYKFNENGLINHISDSNSSVPFILSYDDSSRVKEMSSGKHVAKLIYDDQKRLVKLIREDGSRVQWKLKSNGYVMSILKDPYEILLSRDPHGRLLQLAWGTKERTKDVEVTHVYKVLGTKVK